MALPIMDFGFSYFPFYLAFSVLSLFKHYWPFTPFSPFIAPVFPTPSCKVPSMSPCLFSEIYGNASSSTLIQDSKLASTNKRKM